MKEGLDKSLPIPDIDVSLEKIIKFKRERKDELYQFRKYLSNVQSKIRKTNDEQEIIELLIDTRENIEKSIHDISRTLKDFKIKSIFSSFGTLLKIESPKLFGTLTAAGIITTPINPIAGIAAGTLGVVGSMASSYFKIKREIETSEISYLFMAKQECIINFKWYRNNNYQIPIKNGKNYNYYFCPKCWNEGLKDRNGKGFCSNCDNFKIFKSRCIKKEINSANSKLQ